LPTKNLLLPQQVFCCYIPKQIFKRFNIVKITIADYLGQ